MLNPLISLLFKDMYPPSGCWFHGKLSHWILCGDTGGIQVPEHQSDFRTCYIYLKGCLWEKTNQITKPQSKISTLASAQCNWACHRACVGTTQEPSGNKFMMPSWKWLFFLGVHLWINSPGWKIIKGEGKMTSRAGQLCGSLQNTLNSHFSWHFSFLTLVFVH